MGLAEHRAQLTVLAGQSEEDHAWPIPETGEYVLLNLREEVPEGGVQEGNFLIPRGRSLMSTALFRDRSTDRSPVASRTPSWR